MIFQRALSILFSSFFSLVSRLYSFFNTYNTTFTHVSTHLTPWEENALGECVVKAEKREKKERVFSITINSIVVFFFPFFPFARLAPFSKILSQPSPPRQKKKKKKNSLLSLYRRVLRANRLALPPPLRALGDASAKAEWRAMSDAGKRGEEGRRPPDSAWHTFALEWSRYADSLSSSSDEKKAGPGDRGGDLTEEQVAAMSPEQRESLAALARAAASASGALLSPAPKKDK